MWHPTGTFTHGYFVFKKSHAYPAFVSREWSEVTWGEASAESDAQVHTRLSELFNVNHFIVSQVCVHEDPLR
jgi:hypothetical protein